MQWDIQRSLSGIICFAYCCNNHRCNCRQYFGIYCISKAFVGVYYSNYSLTTYKTLWNMQAFLETTIVPFVLTLIINFLVLSKKLKISPLNFIRGQLKQSGQKNIIKLPKKMPFFSKFRLRILFQNIPSYLTMFLVLSLPAHW